MHPHPRPRPRGAGRLHAHTADGASFVEFSVWTGTSETLAASVTVWTGILEVASMEWELVPFTVADTLHAHRADTPTLAA